MWFERWLSILIVAARAGGLKNASRDDVDRIINGQLVAIEERPYMASLRVRDVHICGGSIISSDAVLTAAHCVEAIEQDEETRPYVAVGTMVNQGLTIEFAIQYMVKHANFEADEYANDIGVLKLRKHIDFSPQIQPIAMAPQEPPVGTLAVLTGWGRMDSIPGMPSHKSDDIRLLKTAAVPTVAFAVCAAGYSQLLALHRGQICAGYTVGGADACQGDAGGPLVHGGRQVGVASFGNGCGEGGNPSVFTSVPEYYDWIRQFVR